MTKIFVQRKVNTVEDLDENTVVVICGKEYETNRKDKQAKDILRLFGCRNCKRARYSG